MFRLEAISETDFFTDIYNDYETALKDAELYNYSEYEFVAIYDEHENEIIRFENKE